jgi:IPT/TIG domain
MSFSRRGLSAGRGSASLRGRCAALVAGAAALTAGMALVPAAWAGSPATLASFASPLVTGGVPSVTKLHPTGGPSTGGTSVTVTGTNLTGATEVHFGSSSASFTNKSARSLKAVAPPGTGTEDVTVTTPEGTSAVVAADRFTYATETPVVERVSPVDGKAHGGQKVKIIGSGFTGASAVHFGSRLSPSFTISKGTTITAVAPRGFGTVDVTVTTSNGTSPASPGDRYEYVGTVPQVSGVSPRTGPAEGGATVTISGENMEDAMAVHFGSVEARSFTVNSETSVTAVSPTQSVGTVDVTVSNFYGTSPFLYCHKQPCAVEDHYKFEGLAITDIAPSSGPSAGGTSVAVSGVGFATGTSATTFKFGSTPVTSANCTSTTECTIVTPPDKAGTVDLQAHVEEVEETSKATPADLFTFE